MDEFTSFMEDWDLQAVVRGCSNSEPFANNSSCLAPLSLLDQENYDLLSFSEIFDSNTGENQEIYTQNNLISAATSNPMSIIPNNCQVKEPDDDQKLMIKMKEPDDDQKLMIKVKEPDDDQKLMINKQSFSESAIPAATCSDVTMAAKSKRSSSRKNQQKRVVKHVAVDDLSSDMWAWRKYGQKPIKGSPYPRSYYRCSSLKGCLARKQVERSSSDPSIFIITYAAEHSHAHPTRRNSLAGSTRIKSCMAKQLVSNNELPKLATIKNECLDTASKTPSMGSAEDDLTQNVRIKNEAEEQVFEDSGSNNNNNEIVMPDIIFSDDLFPSLEDFEGLFMDHQLATTVA